MSLVVSHPIASSCALDVPGGRWPLLERDIVNRTSVRLVSTESEVSLCCRVTEQRTCLWLTRGVSPFSLTSGTGRPAIH
jgi:hypothetical protein